ncbi:MAG TPA: carboxypeptidase regulatory-like domain-containing protein [Pyrinomonadaceae bacterium]|nr:carboxypeptidase regulatory-like domain-containing protein [Pyrinomonadaceae bacterium]
MHKSVTPGFARLAKAFVIGLFVMATAIGGYAQTQITTGTIQGVVTDDKDAAIPGATVEIKNLATNATRTLITDEDGRYVALALQPGTYSVTVTKQGFATSVAERVGVTVGQAFSLPVKMPVAGVEAKVIITETPTVDTVKTESSTTLNETAVNNTPILGRKFEDLLTLTPGVSITQGPDGDEINFNGQRGVFNNVSLDGGDYNNGFFGEQLGGQRAAIDVPLDAVKEFQVVATGASAEFGRTAGGIINVISKSGTNDVHGSAFYFLRHENLSANTEDGKPLQDFMRSQFGGTIGGPIQRDKAFFFLSFEGVREKLTRENLSVPLGAPCSVTTPVITNPAHETAINASAECQRVALLNFFRTARNQEEGLPIEHDITNNAFLGKLDWELSSAHRLAASYNFDYSRNENQTFDVPTYGNSANGIEGPSKINNFNLNLFSTVSTTKLNEAHFSYTREERPRSAVTSNVPADTAMGGFVNTFRFGHPFFLGPTVDELFWRTHVKDNFSIVSGNHNLKFGGEWVHSFNDQVFRGFFEGRYIFDSVSGFLHYATPGAPGSGFGPNAGRCTNGAWTDLTLAMPPCTGATTPLLLFLQGAGPNGPATDAAGASSIKNEDFALFVQDKWQVRPNFTLNLGLRWEAQIFPEPTVAPSATAYGMFLSDPRFPSDGTLHSPKKEFQPRVGFAWDIGSNGKSVLRASYGIYYGRQNMLTQVGSITTNGVQQQTIAGGLFANPTVRPTWPGLVTPTASTCTAGGRTNPFPCFSGVRVFSRDYANPRIYTFNAAFEQELLSDLSLYFDFTHSKGVHLTRFLDYARTGFFAPFLGETMVASAVGKASYQGFTAGMRKRLSKGYQLEWNYTLARDKDDDSNERDPFLDRSFDIFNLSLDYALSDRDIRHKFNFYMFAELPWGFEFVPRLQGRTAQPATPAPRTATNRNTLRKDNEFFSFDWRLSRRFKFGERYALIPTVEMFNTFNSKNRINSLVGAGNQNSLTAPSLFNFDGFLRQGVGDPRQLQLAVKFVF